MVFRPDGKTLATTTADAAQMWDITTRREIGVLRIPIPPNPDVATPGLGPVAFSPDGGILATTANGAVQLWNMTTYRQIGTSLNVGSPNDQPTALAFSPTGGYLAAAVSGGVSIWDIRTNQQIGVSLSTASQTRLITRSDSPPGAARGWPRSVPGCAPPGGLPRRTCLLAAPPEMAARRAGPILASSTIVHRTNDGDRMGPSLVGLIHITPAESAYGTGLRRK